MQTNFLTLYGQFTAVAAAFAVYMLWAMRRIARKREDAAAILLAEKVDTLTLALCCIPAAFVGARLLYCLVRFDFYFIEMGPLSVLRTWEGGFLLYGAAIGAMTAAAFLAKAKGARVSMLLDELAVPGMMAIAICRLAEGTTTEGVGMWVENEFFCRFPFAVQNEWEEWVYAVYLLEMVVALAITIYLIGYRGAPGEKIMTALLLYAGCQVVLESMRMDGCLRIGFVRVSQVLSAVTAMTVTLIRGIRVGKRQAIVSGAICFVCIAAAGIIEWALDKTPINNLLLYGGMIVACAVMIANGMKYARKAEA